MVLIIPTSGCFELDCKNISNQMINIQYNKNIFNIVDNENKCECIHKGYKHHIKQSTYKDIFYKNNTEILKRDIEKFNIYEIENYFDPENPITIETFSEVGNIVIYVNISKSDLCKNVIKRLDLNCEETIFELSDEKNNTFLNSEKIVHNRSDKNLLISKMSSDFSRIIRDGFAKNTEKNQTSSFIWDVYVCINDMDFNTFINIEDSRYSNGMIRTITNVIKNKHHRISDPIKKLTDGFQSGFNNNISFLDKDSLIKSPNTIILDGVGLFKNKIVKQLDYPSFEQYCENNIIIKNIINVDKHKYGINHTLVNLYQQENNIRKVDIPYVSVLNNFNNKLQFSKTSWCLNPDEKTDLDEKNIIRTYYAQFKNISIEDNLADNYRDIINLCLNCNSTTINLNKPDTICYITGVPLFSYYFEIQVPIKVKVNTKKNALIMLCIQVSKYGLAKLSKFDSIFDETIGSTLIHLLCKKNKYKLPIFNTICNINTNYNIIIKKSNKNIEDIIQLIKSEPEKKLVLSMHKYGITLYNSVLLVINPETNDIYMGVRNNNIIDKLLMFLKTSSDVILFNYRMS